MLINKINIKDLSKDGSFINIPLSLSFSTETQEYEDLPNSDTINQVIDYEKIILYPIDNNINEIVDSIKFNLHFLIDNKWEVDSTKYESIGFNSDDIKYKRKKLKRSFLRLSFYDSDDIKVQNLLFYSTIFIDCDSLFSNFINSGSNMSNLKTELITENPRLSSKIKSFEGFNIYLFKDDINKLENKTIYMRVDFSNASNGRTILFTQKGSDPLKEEGYSMNELLNMMFLKVVCKFDMKNRRYTYHFVDKQSNSINITLIKDLNINDPKIRNIINIDLYQAKVI